MKVFILLIIAYVTVVDSYVTDDYEGIDAVDYCRPWNTTVTNRAFFISILLPRRPPHNSWKTGHLCTRHWQCDGKCCLDRRQLYVGVCRKKGSKGWKNCSPPRSRSCTNDYDCETLSKCCEETCIEADGEHWQCPAPAPSDPYLHLPNVLTNFDNTDNFESASYHSVWSTDGYEERFYPAKNWACTEGQVREGEDIANGNFMKLFRYIQGSNDQGESIQMTLSVTTEVTRDVASQMITHRMCFYIPEINQANTPKPTDAEVFIDNRQDMTIFTMKEGGYMSDAAWEEKVLDLNYILATAGENFNTTSYWRITYNSPIQFWNRHNEIWISKN